jgi:tetratricopeptide (TPR) repeat protein
MASFKKTLISWAFTSTDAVIDDQSFESAKALLCSTPDDILANLVVAIALIDKGLLISAKNSAVKCRTRWLAFSKKPVPKTAVNQKEYNEYIDDEILTDGSKTMELSSLCLFVTVIYGALTSFRESTISEMLSSTQEVLKRVLVIPNNKQSGNNVIKEELRHLLILTRIKAMTRLSQLESARNDAVSLLPEIFLNSIDSEDITTDIQLLLPLTMDQMKSTKSIRLRLAVVLLASLGCYAEGARICDLLISTNVGVGVASWVSAEKTWIYLKNLIHEKRKNIRDLGICLGQNRYSYRDILIDQKEIILIVKAFQETLRLEETPILCSEIEPLVKFRIGMAMFLAGGRFRSDKNASMKHLLDSVKGDPLTGEGFTFLGHYYSEVISDVQIDKEKAIKCYTKALGIDPLDEESGWSISEIYMNENNPDKALKLWLDITTLTGHAHWCYPLLGQYYMCHGDYEEAVKSFQKALELQPLNASCWHGLGFSYFSLLSNTAAEKALMQANTLSCNDIPVMCLLGDARRKLCKFTAASECYECALGLEPLDVLALKGKADVCLAFAYQYFSIGRSYTLTRINSYLLSSRLFLAESIFITYLGMENRFLTSMRFTDS